MNEIIDNFKTILKTKYFCVEGRAGRKEFWQFILVSLIGNIILNLIPGLGQALSALWTLALLLPTISVTARRLHDCGKTGWLQLLLLIPVIGGLLVLLLCLPVGSKEENKYGPAL